MAALYPDRFHQLPPAEQAAILDWVAQVAPGRLVFSAELRDEATVVLMTSLRAADQWLTWLDIVDGAGVIDAGVVKRAVYTRQLPPRPLLEVLLAC